MNGPNLLTNIKQIWENRPSILLLLAAGFAIFVFIVVDAWLHKRRKRKQHPRKH